MFEAKTINISYEIDEYMFESWMDREPKDKEDYEVFCNAMEDRYKIDFRDCALQECVKECVDQELEDRDDWKVV